MDTALVFDLARPIEYPIALVQIEAMRVEFADLPAAIATEKGEAECRSARHKIRGARGTIEATRKVLKADALAYGKKVDAGAAKLVELLDAIAFPIEAAITTLDAERERIKAEALRAEQERQERERREEWEREQSEIRRVEDERRAKEDAERAAAEALRLEEAKAEAARAKEREEQVAREFAEMRAARAKEKAEDDARRKADDERMAEERRALAEAQSHAQEQFDRQREEMAAAQRQIDAERAELQRQREEADRIARVESDRIEAARVAEVQAEEAIRREEEDRIAAEQDAERIASLRSDSQKLVDFSVAIRAVRAPEVESGAAQDRLAEACDLLDVVVRELRRPL